MRTPSPLIDSLAAFWRECGGVAVIEFAITMPLIVALLLPLTDLGMGFYRKTQLMTAAEAGAEYAWRNPSFSTAASSTTAIATIQTVVQNATGLGSTSVPTTDISVALSCKCVDSTTNQFSSSITATSSATCTAQPSCSGANVPGKPGLYVNVTIDHSGACSSSPTDAVCYKPLFTYGIFGSVMKLTVTSTVRVSS